MTNVFFDYDSENDSIFIYRKEKTRGSIDIGDFILDISYDGKVVGIEILNASKSLKSFNLTKEDLENIKMAGFRVEYKKDAVYVQILLVLPENVEKKAMVIAPIQITQKS